MKKNMLITLRMKSKKEILNLQNFCPYGICLGVGLGFCSTVLGKKATMLCTASVEEVIDKHYQNQINQIESDEKELRNKDN